MDDSEKKKSTDRINALELLIQSLQEHIRSLEKRINILLSPPNQICTVLEIDTKKKRAVIKTAGGFVYLVNIDTELKVKNLRVDQEVIVNSTMNIVAFRQPNSSLLMKSKESGALKETELTEIPDVTFKQIGGLKSAISEINDAIELPYLYPDLFHKNEYEIPKGILLYGPPGCGKTMLGKAIANQLAIRLQLLKGFKKARCAFLHVSGPALIDKYVGESPKNIRKLFEKAREIAKKFPNMPVIIFIDEIDALLPLRDSGTSGVAARTVPQFTSEFDGVKALNGVIVVATTNRQDLIDPAVLRRFQTKIKVHRPNEAAAKSILAKYLTKNLFFDSKYFVDSFADGKQVFKFNSDPEKIANYLINETIKKLFDCQNTKKILELIFKNGETKLLNIFDLISGAIIKDIINRAKLLSIKAEITDKAQGGISKECLLAIIEQKYEEMFSALEYISLPNKWVKTNGIDTNSRVVIQVRIISPNQKGRGNSKRDIGFGR